MAAGVAATVVDEHALGHDDQNSTSYDEGLDDAEPADDEGDEEDSTCGSKALERVDTRRSLGPPTLLGEGQMARTHQALTG